MSHQKRIFLGVFMGGLFAIYTIPAFCGCDIDSLSQAPAVTEGKCTPISAKEIPDPNPNNPYPTVCEITLGCPKTQGEDEPLINITIMTQPSLFYKLRVRYINSLPHLSE